jgi:hypothetical protein
MSENASEWGMCAAHGCPLFGTLGGAPWYCFCHHGRPNGANDAITMHLRGELSPIVEATLSIRRCFGSFRDHPDVYRSIQKALINADRRDLLLGEADCSPHRPGKPIVKQWLARLERELIKATEGYGRQQGLSGIVPTAPIIGPTHAMTHYTETDE